MEKINVNTAPFTLLGVMSVAYRQLNKSLKQQFLSINRTIETGSETQINKIKEINKETTTIEVPTVMAGDIQYLIYEANKFLQGENDEQKDVL